ncbi:MAG TPA: lysylphosphatidylglycerol synthase transmembrane domain-containing protein [Gemmatimonadales bacterium]|nr:lysylphosphatidylglycerol synthase transmembrane domain-containing protein [Gemmatimonadales bacterium]
MTELAAAPAAAPPRRRKMALAWLLTAAFVATLVSQVDLRGAWHHVITADALLLTLAFAVLAADRIFQAAKWYPLATLQAPDLRLWPSIRAYHAAFAASFLLPASIGGDVLRAMALGRARNAVAEIGASIAMERVLGLTALVIANLAAVLIAFPPTHHLRSFRLWALSLVALGLGALLASLSHPIRARMRAWARRGASSRWVRGISRFGRAYTVYRNHPGTMLGVLLLSLLETGLVVVIMWILGLAINSAITLRMLLVVTPITLVLYRLPITIWGLGIAEGGFAFLLDELYGIAVAEAVALSLLFRVLELCVALPGALLWRDLVGLRPRASEP